MHADGAMPKIMGLPSPAGGLAYDGGHTASVSVPVRLPDPGTTAGPLRRRVTSLTPKTAVSHLHNVDK